MATHKPNGMEWKLFGIIFFSLIQLRRRVFQCSSKSSQEDEKDKNGFVSFAKLKNKKKLVIPRQLCFILFYYYRYKIKN